MEVRMLTVNQFYQNGITALTDHADLMLAELDLPDVQVAMINRAKTKLLCSGRLIEKGLYEESRALENDAVYDLADVVDFLGLSDIADSIRNTYASL